MRAARFTDSSAWAAIYSGGPPARTGFTPMPASFTV